MGRLGPHRTQTDLHAEITSTGDVLNITTFETTEFKIETTVLNSSF